LITILATDPIDHPGDYINRRRTALEFGSYLHCALKIVAL